MLTIAGGILIAVAVLVAVPFVLGIIANIFWVSPTPARTVLPPETKAERNKRYKKELRQFGYVVAGFFGIFGAFFLYAVASEHFHH